MISANEARTLLENRNIKSTEEFLNEIEWLIKDKSMNGISSLIVDVHKSRVQNIVSTLRNYGFIVTTKKYSHMLVEDIVDIIIEW